MSSYFHRVSLFVHRPAVIEILNLVSGNPSRQYSCNTLRYNCVQVTNFLEINLMENIQNLLAKLKDQNEAKIT